MKNLRPLLPFLALLCACGNPSGNTSENAANTPEIPSYALAFQGASYREKSCTKEPCTYVSIEYPVLKGGNHSATINQNVENDLRETIKARLPEPEAMGTWQELAEKFLEGYAMFVQEFNDTSQKWFLKIESSKSVLTEEHFTAYILTSEYMGGAHPNTYAMLTVFDLESGEVVNVTDLVDEDALKMEAEKMFRSIHRLRPGAPLDDMGFFFPGGVFALPANMGISSEGILLVYNPYEVTDYSKGMTVFTVPFAALNREVKES